MFNNLAPFQSDPTSADAASYIQTDLVSDIVGLATIADPELINPFGVSHSSTSPFWVSNNAINTSTLYAVTDSTNVTKTEINPPSGFVAIPTTASGTASGNQGPTGQVSNTFGSSFPVGNGGDGSAAHFIFANDNGTISAWDIGTTAFIQATTAGADYSGLAISQNLAQPLLYAANNAGTGSIDIFNSSFAPVSPGAGGLVAGAFATPAAISALGLNPFNVQDIHGSVYVTYALPGNPQNTAAVGEGAVAKFDESGNLEQTIVGGQLASPWGIALAPAGFGQFGGDLLVGNESSSDSVINAFDPVTGAFEGTIPINVGSGNTPGGLWALDFGTGGANGSPDTLYFTDGINGQADGRFGAISPVTSPVTVTTIGNASNTFNETISGPGALTVGNGKDTVNVSGGTDASIKIGNGTDNLTFSGGTDNNISIGNGDDTVSLSGGSGIPNSLGTGNTVTLGNGADTVTAAASNRITLGNGDDTVFAGANDAVTLGNGKDTIYVGRGDTVTVGTGHDSFVFQQTTPGNIGAVTVVGFDPNKDSFTFSNQLTTSVSYHDNAQGNAAITVDNNPADTITLVGVHAAALHPSDFHFADPAAVAADAHLAATAAAHAFLL
jgi:uncharacterized protein (TIGR03118 family)